MHRTAEAWCHRLHEYLGGIVRGNDRVALLIACCLLRTLDGAAVGHDNGAANGVSAGQSPRVGQHR
jgi:hypothetical protein